MRSNNSSRVISSPTKSHPSRSCVPRKPIDTFSNIYEWIFAADLLDRIFHPVFSQLGARLSRVNPAPLTEVEKETRNRANLQIPSNWKKPTSLQFHGVSYLFWRLTASWLANEARAISQDYISRATCSSSKKEIDKSDRLPDLRSTRSFFHMVTWRERFESLRFPLMTAMLSLSLSLSLSFFFLLRSIHTRDQPEGFVYTWESEPQRRALPRYSCLLLRFLLVITR